MPKIATKGDKVVGTDTHVVMVPSPGGPVPTPLPHTFRGTIVSGCEESATINGRPIAVVGAEAVNDTPHVPTPPGTSFQTPPRNKSKIVSTITTMELNGKYVVVEGSPAMNCNDPVDAPTGVVQVEGCSIEWEPVTDWKPVPRFNYDEYVAREKKKEERRRKSRERQKLGAEHHAAISEDESANWEVTGLKIADEYIIYGAQHECEIQITGEPKGEISIELYVMDEEGNLSGSFYEYQGDASVLKMNNCFSLRAEISKDKLKKVLSTGRLWVIGRVFREEDCIYEMHQDEIKEIVFNGVLVMPVVHRNRKIRSRTLKEIMIDNASHFSEYRIEGGEVGYMKGYQNMHVESTNDELKINVIE